ncbi:MAG TPA: hypothetical protein VLE74_03050 [Candidatus Saccharimonadales bacterium]|nr:hypothetical protein [Candidatus Saccharimonadales bacterium]
MAFQFTHLDAVQGSQEERVSRIRNTVNERQTPADTAMRQERRQSLLALPESEPAR